MARSKHPHLGSMIRWTEVAVAWKVWGGDERHPSAIRADRGTRGADRQDAVDAAKADGIVDGRVVTRHERAGIGILVGTARRWHGNLHADDLGMARGARAVPLYAVKQSLGACTILVPQDAIEVLAPPPPLPTPAPEPDPNQLALA